ncbi:transcriptional regulator [Indibacter alkaliphilus LW1]|jgi:AraC-like DNA-binding protein|uniref:Transcriptional regulator n=1 Tax=Indibacter alkaliphilus (strain CCUG 57479 / KCTC 22604 / LW1) TaxID=1189612 RepID=S2DLC2_INDAL|nr:AraC family transcriptional regulator [Indibacter alkaliphilus]EOZ98010.1 transcriptional regulator [Indibacter alkaliphilus LW1]
MKKIISFQIPKSNKEFVRFQVDAGKHFYDKLHQHPQWQLTWIKEGKGQLMVGDYLGRFEKGDLYLLSANMPHVFRSDAEFFDPDTDKQSLGNTLFFDFEALGKGLLEVEEFAGLHHWLQQTKGSFKVLGKTKESILEIMEDFKDYQGLGKILAALHVLQALQEGNSLQGLNKLVPQKDYTETEGKRMGQVMSYILSQSQNAIGLQEVAEVANLSKEAFCRFFKERTGKTFTEFLTQVRIHQACQLLQESDWTISQIAYHCGFQNLSYFNRAFKKAQGETPKEYRSKMSYQ